MKRAPVVFAAIIALAVLAAAPATAAGNKPVTKQETITLKTTIQAIDHDRRIITLATKDGETEDVYAGPEVRRFDELKVGDKVTFKYTGSVVLQIRKPGEAVPPSTHDDPAVVRNTTEKPSAKVTEQATETVLIKAVDLKTPSVTFQTEDGATHSAKVEDKGLLKNVKPGDHVVISYTAALLISVE
jgi:Cu/Ag efflux protein CusF